MPHTLRNIRVDEAQIAELTVLAGFDDDLAAQITAASNRLRGMLTQIHPALERVLGPRVTDPAVAGTEVAVTVVPILTGQLSSLIH